MRDYISEKWKDTLKDNNLSTFESFWELDTGWVEEPNHRRGGWSGVIYHPITGPDKKDTGLFVKKQSNHVHKSALHPFRGTPTLIREMKNILLCRTSGIPVYEPVFFSVQKMDAILVTEELKDFIPMTSLIADWPAGKMPGMEIQKRILGKLSEVIRRLHSIRRQHGALAPKHLYIKSPVNSDNIEIRLIDMEKMKRRPLGNGHILRDLDTLNRHTLSLTLTIRMRFLMAYLQQEKLNDDGKDLWRSLASRREKKLKQGKRDRK